MSKIKWQFRLKNGMLPRSRREAIDQNESIYFTGIPCKRGHVSARYVASRKCIDCQTKENRERVFSDTFKNGQTKLRDIDNALADKALARELKEIWGE